MRGAENRENRGEGHRGKTAPGREKTPRAMTGIGGGEATDWKNPDGKSPVENSR